MDVLIDFLARQPLLALFLVIAVGYAIGAVNIKGFSLGVGAVLFSGLFIGAIAPKAQPPAILGTLGLVMFLYGLGVMFGKQFFAGLAGKAGRRYNLLAGLALLGTFGAAVVELSVMDVSHPMMAGLFAGAGTNAATMQAAMEAAGNSEPAVGYSVAFPFGLVGAILCMYVMQLLVKPELEANRTGLHILEVAVHGSDVVGQTVGGLVQRMPSGVKVLIARVGDKNRHPDPDLVLSAGDVLMIGSEDRSSLEAARRVIGEHALGRVTADRTHMDLLRVFVSRAHLQGTRVGELKLPDGVHAEVVLVQRGDVEVLVTSELTFELGDRVGLITARPSFPILRKFFGDSIRGTTEFSYVSLGLGMVLGVLLGSIPLPVPGLGSIKIGVAGGSLVMALILGKIGRLGPITWTMPLSANLTLRNFGLSIFLAQVGMSSGAPFVNTVASQGPILLVAGAAMLLVLALTPLLVGHFVMRIPFGDLMGVTAGVTGNPAILAYAFRSYPSDRVEICYAMIFPAATIVKIVMAQVLIAMGAT